MTENLSLPDNIIKNTIREKLLEKYNNNTIIRGLIQVVPYGAVVDNVLSVAYNNILVERSNVFFDELSLGNIELTPELVENEDFLHAYFSTYRAAIYTKQREKIRFFARMLNSGLITNLIGNAEEFDDYLKILDELTFREIYILYVLENYECNNIEKENETILQLVSRHWYEFEKVITDSLNIATSELQAWLSRMERTGCFSFIRGSYFDYSGDQGYTTEAYYKLKQLIKLKEEDLVYYRRT